MSTGSWASASFGFFHLQRLFHLHSPLSSASASVTSTTAISSLTASINLLFGLPRFLFPGNSILSIVLPIYPSSFLSTCPYHLSIASRVFSANRPTCAVSLMYSFLILSILVTPNENRNIFNSATSISTSCLFVCKMSWHIITSIVGGLGASRARQAGIPRQDRKPSWWRQVRLGSVKLHGQSSSSSLHFSQFYKRWESCTREWLSLFYIYT